MALKKQLPLSMLLIDIDNFRQYNDTYGYFQGDIIVKELARLLKTNMPPGAILARYGGEEFAVILLNYELNDAMNVAENLRQRVEKHEFTGETSQPLETLTVSIGVSNLPYHAQNIREFLKAADEALFSSKFTGRNKSAKLPRWFRRVRWTYK